MATTKQSSVLQNLGDYEIWFYIDQHFDFSAAVKRAKKRLGRELSYIAGTAKTLEKIECELKKVERKNMQDGIIALS